LLADIIETRSGRPFTEYVHAELFAPAKMEQSGFYPDPIWQQVDTAIGYDANTFGTNDPASWPLTWALVGNGGLVSTVLDLERWVTAVWKGQVLSPDALDAYRAYLAQSGEEIEGKTVYATAGAGDYGLGGVVLECPEVNTRVIIGTNTYEVFDIEKLGVELGQLVLSK
jgi:CubicO group peptidase (beta-lactamase class C family)